MKIVVGMSGGVDSAVVASILKDEGHEVLGVTFKLWQYQPTDDVPQCCSATDMFDACRVSSLLGIDYHVISRQTKFMDEIVNPYIRDLSRGITPSPCIRCNETVKLGPLMEVMTHFKADAFATGHYANVSVDHRGDIDLRKGADTSKDQSYYLWSTDASVLKHMRTPLGTWTKDQTREYARSKGLHVASKRDSTDLCFLEGRKPQEFLEEHAGAIGEGKVVDDSGSPIGSHKGFYRYTRGQGLHGRFVLKVIPNENLVVVGPRESLKVRFLELRDVKALTNTDGLLTAKLRSHGTPLECELLGNRLHFLEPQESPNAGQAAVLYRGDRVVAGGFTA